MIGYKVKFMNGNGNLSTGVIHDKVKVLAVEHKQNYDNYIIEESTGRVHTVNPLNLREIVSKPQTEEELSDLVTN